MMKISNHPKISYLHAGDVLHTWLSASAINTSHANYLKTTFTYISFLKETFLPRINDVLDRIVVKKEKRFKTTRI